MVLVALEEVVVVYKPVRTRGGYCCCSSAGQDARWSPCTASVEAETPAEDVYCCRREHPLLSVWCSRRAGCS